MSTHITDADWRKLLVTRAHSPHIVAQAYATRQRRESVLTERGTFSSSPRITPHGVP